MGEENIDKISGKIIWHNEKRRIDELKMFPDNPRMAGEKEVGDLDKSLQRFNLADPLIINTDNVVIGGNFRLSRLRKMGIIEADVRVPNRTLTKEEAMELNLRLNKNLGAWDKDILANFNEDLLKDVGFENEELDEIFGLEMDDEFDVEKEFEKTIKNPRGVKDGDLWQLGEHQLYIGDAVKKESWEKVLGNERFDMLFTDPPYRIGYRIGMRKQKTKEGFKIQKLRTYPTVGMTTKEGKPFDVEKSPLKSVGKYFGAKKNRGYLGVDIKGGGSRIR